MKHIFASIIVLALATVTIQAQESRLMKPYLKASLSLLSAEADGEREYFGYEEDEPRNLALSFVEKECYVVDGNGIMLEIGVGEEVVKNLHVGVSFLYGSVSMDGNAVYQTTATLKDLATDEILDQASASGGYVADVDLCTIGGMFDIVEKITPKNSVSLLYGIGVGFSYNMLDDLNLNGVRSADAVTIKGDETFSFAWSLNLGVAFAVTDNLSLNLMYKYIDLGTAESGKKLTDSDGNSGTRDNAIEFDVTAHKVGVGIAYAF